MTSRSTRTSWKKFWEQWYPLAGAAGAFIVAWYCQFLPPERRLNNLLGAVLTVSSIAVGFIGTARSHLLSIRDRQSVKAVMKGTGGRVHAYFNWAIVLAAILALLCVVGFFLPLDEKNPVSQWYFAIWFALLFGAGLAAFRVLRIMGEFLISE